MPAQSDHCGRWQQYDVPPGFRKEPTRPADLGQLRRGIGGSGRVVLVSLGPSVWKIRATREVFACPDVS